MSVLASEFQGGARRRWPHSASTSDRITIVIERQTRRRGPNTVMPIARPVASGVMEPDVNRIERGPGNPAHGRLDSRLFTHSINSVVDHGDARFSVLGALLAC